MSYSAGRLQILNDTTTDKESYTNETFNAMTISAVNQFCSLFDMVIFNDLTEQTTRGNRYFIGFNGADYPSLAIGWAVDNAYTNGFFLLAVAMFQGEYLSNAFNDTGSSTINNSTYCFVILQRRFDTTSFDYTYINYIKTSNFVGITASYAGSSPTVVISNKAYRICMAMIDSIKMMSYISNGLITLDYTNDGLSLSFCTDVNLRSVKNIIANNDFNYICQIYASHAKAIKDIYIYSNELVVGNIYKINGEYYICIFKYTSSDNSYLVKLADYEP